MSSYIQHHGIKGQKWGIRRFQNKDGSLTPAGEKRYYVESDKKEIKQDNKSSTLPKGYQFNRVGQSELDVNKAGALYVSTGKADAARYIKSLGPTTIGKLMGQYGTTVQHITVKSDIKKASDDETIRLTAELLSKNPTLRKAVHESMYARSVGQDVDEKNIKEGLKNPRGKEATKMAYATSAILADPNYTNEAKVVYEYFRKNGYDAIPDLNDKYTGTSSTPTIIINPNKLEVTSKTTITKDVMKSAKTYVKSLEKLPVNELLDKR